MNRLLLFSIIVVRRVPAVAGVCVVSALLLCRLINLCVHSPMACCAPVRNLPGDGGRGPQKQLTEAAATGNVVAAQKALDAGAEVDSTQYGPPLFHACSNGKIKTVALLLDMGADPNLEDAGEYALHVAAYTGSPEVVNLLIKAKADVYMKDKDRHTALDVSRHSKRRYEPQVSVPCKTPPFF